jgi:DNA-binding NarL/FixJ family response regulator
MIRTLVADDEALARQSIRLVLEADDEITVVDEAANGTYAVESARRHRPDIAIVDVHMPHDGLVAAREMLRLEHPPRVIMLTTFALDEYLYTALEAGVDGFLTKDVQPEDLISAVKVVARGEAIISPSMTRSLIQRHTSSLPARGMQERLRALPEVQRDILALLAEGQSNAEIGACLDLTESQVKVHISRILRLLRLTNRVQAAILAYSAGLAPRRCEDGSDKPRI